MPLYKRSNTPEEDLTEDEQDELLNGDQNLEPKTPEETTWKKRYGDLRSHTQKQINELKAQINELTERSNSVASNQIDLPATPEEVEEWSRKYPKIAAVFETLAIQKYKKLNESVQEKFKELDKRSAETASEKALLELKKFHPDFDDIQNDENFHAWLLTKSKRTQDTIYENDTDYMAAAETIDLYKAQTGYGSTKRKQDASNPRDAARDVPRRTNTTPSNLNGNDFVIKESEIEAMSPSEYDKYEEQIEKAIKEGRVEYDLTNAREAAKG